MYPRKKDCRCNFLKRTAWQSKILLCADSTEKRHWMDLPTHAPHDRRNHLADCASQSYTDSVFFFDSMRTRRAAVAVAKVQANRRGREGSSCVVCHARPAWKTGFLFLQFFDEPQSVNYNQAVLRRASCGSWHVLLVRDRMLTGQVLSKKERLQVCWTCLEDRTHLACTMAAINSSSSRPGNSNCTWKRSAGIMTLQQGIMTSSMTNAIILHVAHEDHRATTYTDSLFLMDKCELVLEESGDALAPRTSEELVRVMELQSSR